MHEQELEALLKETLTYNAKTHRDRVADLEYAIVEELPSRRPGRGSQPSWRWGLAVAGALALFLGGLWVGSTVLGGAPCADPQVLCLVYPGVTSVSLASQFTLWEPLPMNGPDRSGVWWIRLPETIKPGRYEYGFIVDGVRWVSDPRATEFVHTFDDKINSVLYIAPRGEQP
jgi:hypothetical protein